MVAKYRGIQNRVVLSFVQPYVCVQERQKPKKTFACAYVNALQRNCSASLLSNLVDVAKQLVSSRVWRLDDIRCTSTQRPGVV